MGIADQELFTDAVAKARAEVRIGFSVVPDGNDEEF
jgi:hypothetical protein